MAHWRKHQHGTGATLDLGNGLSASVSWEAVHRLDYDAPHFNVSVLGTRLPGRSATMNEGKARAESGLKAALEAALAKLT